MIAGIHGRLRSRGHDHVVVSVGGFDVRAFVSTTTLGRIGNVGEAVDLATHLYLREEVLALYGFADEAEHATFEKLLTVAGVGPRVALTLLSTFTSEALREAIVREDAVALSRAPGVGRKLAGRLILELRPSLGADGVASAAPRPPATDELLEALQSLGMSVAEAQAVAEHADVRGADSTEERVRRALQHFAARRF